MGAPSSGIPTSRTSTNVSAIVSGKSHAPMFDVLHNLTGEKRNASSAFRALRPGAAAISTPARPVSAKPSICANRSSAQRLDRDATAFGKGEVVLDQRVLGSDPAADHAVAALRATGAL